MTGVQAPQAPPTTVPPPASDQHNPSGTSRWNASSRHVHSRTTRPPPRPTPRPRRSRRLDHRLRLHPVHTPPVPATAGRPGSTTSSTSATTGTSARAAPVSSTSSCCGHGWNWTSPRPRVGVRRPGADVVNTLRHPAPRTPRPTAYGAKVTCRGVSARSGWRVNTATFLSDRFRAVPRTDTPRRGTDPRRTPGEPPMHPNTADHRNPPTNQPTTSPNQSSAAP
jgi:hypothetical protein